MLKSIARQNTPDFEAQAEKIVEETSDLSHVHWIEEDGIPIAVLTLEEGYFITCLKVAPQHRRKGHAKSLLASVMGSNLTVAISVMESDEWVYEWLERLGFQECDSTQDEVYMHLVVPEPNQQVKTYSRHNTADFCSTASALVHDLYLAAFGPEHPVTPEFIEQQRITKVYCIEQDGTVVAATMLKRFGCGFYVQGIAVQSKRKGYGTKLMEALIDSVPEAGGIQLGVDTGKQSTDWLTEWYMRLGFVHLGSEDSQIILFRYPHTPKRSKDDDLWANEAWRLLE